VRRTGESILLASTQGHHSMEGRAIVRTGSLAHATPICVLRIWHGCWG
jgi:hypothetical protein